MKYSQDRSEMKTILTRMNPRLRTIICLSQIAIFLFLITYYIYHIYYIIYTATTIN
jgi:hypothetical protein